MAECPNPNFILSYALSLFTATLSAAALIATRSAAGEEECGAAPPPSIPSLGRTLALG